MSSSKKGFNNEAVYFKEPSYSHCINIYSYNFSEKKFLLDFERDS